MTEIKREKLELGFIAAILLVAIVLRFTDLSGPSLTSDEVIDLQIAQLRLDQIWKNSDGFPPLHYFLLHGALEAGSGENAGRYLAAGCGVLTVFFVYLLSRLFFDTRTATLAATLFAIWPTAVYYNREGRAYSLYLMVAALGILLFYRALEKDRILDWAAFVLAAAIGLFTHYYLAYLWCALAVVWLWRAKSDIHCRKGAIAWTCFALLVLPILDTAQYDFALNQVYHNRAEFGWSTVAFSGWTMLTGFCLGSSLSELHTLSLADAVAEITLWVPLVLVVCLILVAQLIKKGGCREAELAILLFVPAGLALLATPLVGIAFNVRYIVACLIPLILLIARGLSFQPIQKWQVLAGGILLLTSVVSLGNRYWNERYQNEDSRAAAEFLRQQSDEFPIFVVSDYMRLPLRHYLPGPRPVLPIEPLAAGEDSTVTVLKSMKQAMGDHQHFWLFYSRPFHGDPEGHLLAKLLESEIIQEQGSWSGVRLFRGEFAEKKEPKDHSDGHG